MREVPRAACALRPCSTGWCALPRARPRPGLARIILSHSTAQHTTAQHSPPPPYGPPSSHQRVAPEAVVWALGAQRGRVHTAGVGRHLGRQAGGGGAVVAGAWGGGGGAGGEGGGGGRGRGGGDSGEHGDPKGTAAPAQAPTNWAAAAAGPGGLLGAVNACSFLLLAAPGSPSLGQVAPTYGATRLTGSPSMLSAPYSSSSSPLQQSAMVPTGMPTSYWSNSTCGTGAVQQQSGEAAEASE